MIETWQDSRFIQSDTRYIQYTKSERALHYPRGIIETGPFQIYVTLQYDNIKSCGNGYNSEEKRSETVRKTSRMKNDHLTLELRIMLVQMN